MRNFDGGTIAALIPYERSVWIALDGSGRLTFTAGLPEFLTNSDRDLWIEAGMPNMAESDDRYVGPGGLASAVVQSLPLDPEDLDAYLRNQGISPGWPSEAALFDRIGDLLRETDLNPRARSALYTVASSIEGIKLVSDVTERAGRPGIAVGLD